MATEKIINTRIQLKYDTLENWNANSSLILKKGEVGVCAVPTDSSHLQTTPPAIMFKVGDGKTTFGNLPWASALAADVYAWAKAAVRPAYKYGDTDLTGFGSAATKAESYFDKSGAASTAESNAKAYTDEKIAAIPLAAEYTLETGATDGSLVLKKDGIAVGDPAVVAGWAELLAKAEQGISDAAAKYTKPTGGIPKTDLASAVQTSLGKADSALQAHQSIATGSTNGTIAVAGKDVAVKGLGSAAYTASSAYATAEQGAKADKAMPSSGGYATGTIEFVAGYTATLGRDPVESMEATTKQYVDTEIGKIDQFKYTISTDAATTPKDVIWYNGTTKIVGTLVASATTEYNIYLVPCKHSAEQEQEGYDEYLTVKSGSTYSWEVLGNTRDIDLSGYVPTSRKINNKALTADITLAAADVGVTETAFPGLNKTGTVTAVKMNGTTKNPTSGIIDLGDVITAHQDISGKQDKLTTAQANAVNSGITADKVTKYDGYESTINGKQATLSEAQLAAANSGITKAKVTTYDGYASKISTLEGKAGLDKVGTVTSVSAGIGLKITGTASVTPKVEIDDDVVFVFNCGSATELVD